MKTWTWPATCLAMTCGLVSGTETARAEDFHVNAPVVAALVSRDGGVLTRRFALDLPAGIHRVFLPYDTNRDASVPTFRSDAAMQIVSVTFAEGLGVEPEAFFSDAQKEAKADLDAAEAELLALKGKIAEREREKAALQARLNFIFSVKAPTESLGDPAAITGLADLVAAETGQARSAQAGIEEEIRQQHEALEALELQLRLKEVALKKLAPPTEDTSALVLTLDMPTAQTVQVDFDEWSNGIGWVLVYDVRLDSEAGPTLTLDRSVGLYQDTGLPFLDVDLSLSTAKLFGQIGPHHPWKDRAWIREERPPEQVQSSLRREAHDEPMMEPVIIAEETGSTWVTPDGETVGYTFDRPVTLPIDDQVLLRLDQLTFPADLRVEASPRRDKTAFQVAEIVNASKEAILPGDASFYRDGRLLGYGELDLIPAGKSEVLPFGPVEGLRLSFVRARNETGDRGILSSSNQRSQALSLRVENLTGATQDVRMLYALPYSEQEDLSVEIRSTPAPDETDIDDERGVSAWNLTIPSGETVGVELQVEMQWPEGWELNWSP